MANTLSRHLFAWLHTKATPIHKFEPRARLGFETLEDRTCPTSVALVKDILSDIGTSNPSNFVEVNGTLFFTADDGVHGVELWKSDGTPTGTVMVKDINPSGSSIPQSLTNVNGTLFFKASDGVNGAELWKSDGTPTGTVMVKDINPSGSSIPQSLTNVNGTLFFVAHDGVRGSELWKSDGTAAGTVLVKDIAVGASSDPTWLTNVNGTLFFTAYSDYGNELWKSDGTATGTVMVKDINPSGNSNPQSLTNVNGTLFFKANDGVHSVELWKSDGTPTGTVMVKDINPSGSSNPQSLTNVNGTLFFTADDGVHGVELWKSDGTPAGTVLVKDINPSGNSIPEWLTNVNGTLFFKANDGVNGAELWKSDGTATGTVMVKKIGSGIFGSTPTVLTNVNGTLFFVADDGIHGRELWKSDGTATGTVLVKDIHSGIYNSLGPSAQLISINGTLFFAADDGIHGTELWRASAFADDFNRANSTDLGAGWSEVVGNLAINSNRLRATSPSRSSALVTAAAAANVWVTTWVSLPTTGRSRADLLLRARNATNAYFGTLVGNDGTFTASIRRDTTVLASAPVTLLSGQARLRFEAAGSLLKLFVNDVLVASVIDGTYKSGKVGLAGTRSVRFDDFFISPVEPQLPAGDSFERNAYSADLGSLWRETTGNMDIYLNRMAALASGNNVAIYQWAALRDVAVQARVTLPSYGGTAGLVTRYSGPGNRNYYLGAIVGTSGAYTARIYRNLNGTLTQLASAPISTGSGLLRFEVVGNSLKLYLNGNLVVRATDATIPSVGYVGVRGTQASTFDDFNAERLYRMLFLDGFNRPDGGNLGPQWGNLGGGTIGIVSNQAQVTNTGVNLAVRHGIKVLNTTLEATVMLSGSGNSEAGLVARAQNANNYYYAALERNSGAYRVAIYKVVNSVKTRIGSFSASASFGKLRFRLAGNSLQLFFDDVLLVSVTDSTFTAAGLAGLRGTQNTTFDDFTMTRTI